MDDKFEPLKPDEVAYFGKDWKDRDEMFNLPLVFLASQAHTNIAGRLTYLWKDYRETKQQLFNEGLDGEALKFGADGWQKGKIRFRVIVEFCPEEPEEEETEKTQETEQSETSEETSTNQIDFNNFDSLDDLRRELNQEN